MENKEPKYHRSYQKLLGEINQDHKRRKPLFEELENQFDGKGVVSFFTSFRFPVLIDDSDPTMLEEVFQNTDLSKGLVLVIDSPGGDGLAAERIINVCRTYSNDNFEVVAPHMAKSAATMICMGANKIWMSPTSELGPIDPQVIAGDKRFSVHSIITSYQELFDQAVKAEGRIEPFLQQLSKYDAREIESYKAFQKLSKDIAKKSLKRGMMKEVEENEILNKIDIFLKAEETQVHGRPINYQQTREAGLNVELINNKSKLWHLLWDLYLRTHHIVTNQAGKIIESKTDVFLGRPNQ